MDSWCTNPRNQVSLPTAVASERLGELHRARLWWLRQIEGGAALHEAWKPWGEYHLKEINII